MMIRLLAAIKANEIAADLPLAPHGAGARPPRKRCYRSAKIEKHAKRAPHRRIVQSEIRCGKAQGGLATAREAIASRIKAAEDDRGPLSASENIPDPPISHPRSGRNFTQKAKVPGPRKRLRAVSSRRAFPRYQSLRRQRRIEHRKSLRSHSRCRKTPSIAPTHL